MNEKVLGSTVRIDLTTHVLATGALIAPSSAFAAVDFRVYKDGSASEKATTNGITVTSPFDSITGKHLIEIDTNNATGDSGFWAAGSEYRVEINSAKTIDGEIQTGVTVGRFRLVSADVLRTDGYTAPANSDIAAAKAAAESIAEMLPNTDYLAGAVTNEGAAVLDAAARVKLAADQPDYAPATTTALTAALTKIRKFFQLSLRKDAAISTDNATELTEINADGGSGIGGYLSTTDSQEAIRDNSGGGGGGSATAENQTTIIGHLTDIKGTGWSSATDTLKKIRDAISNLISTSVVVPGPVLTAVGMPATLEIGDSYEEESCLTIYIRDENDDPVSAAVGHDFTDGDFAPTFIIAPTPGSSRGRVKGIVTYVDPGGSDEPYLKVEIPSSQSKLAVAGEASVQLVLKWTGAEKTLLNTTVIWLPRI
jgi:hypothetical protein